MGNEKWHHAFCKSILHWEVAKVQNESFLVTTFLHIFHNRSLEDSCLLLHPSTYFFENSNSSAFCETTCFRVFGKQGSKKDYLWTIPSCLGISPPQPGLHRSIPSNARSFRSLNASPICGLRCHGQNRALWVFGRMLDVLPSRMC